MSEISPEVYTTKEKQISIWRRLFASRESGVFVALVALTIIMHFANPYFSKNSRRSARRTYYTIAYSGKKT